MKAIKESIKRYIKGADLTLLFLALLISGIGLVLIYSATRDLPNPNRYIYVQAAAIVAGAVGFVIISILDLQRFPNLWIGLFVFNILFQISLKFLGVAGDTGNKSWIPIPGIGINVQPGEVGKIIFIFTLACHIDRLKEKLNSPWSVIQLVLHMGITAASVFVISKDMGVTLMYPLIFIIMLFGSGVSLWWMLAALAGVTGMAPLLWKFMDGYQRDRILVVFDPGISPRLAWHAKQSMGALRRGGVSGLGFMNGANFVNDHNDFIFAACGQQFGFIGCIALLILLTLLVLKVFMNSFRADDLFGRLLCIGISGMLMVQILINVGMCAGVMPVIGLTLPLVSYGGSSVLTTIAALGLCAGLRLRRRPDWLRNSQTRG